MTGAAVTAGLLAWSARGYLLLARDSRYAGALLIGGGLALVATLNLTGALAAMAATLRTGVNVWARFTVLTTLLVALGMHLLVFEDMTQELRMMNRQLAGANEEIQRLAITDPLTGCHIRRFFDESSAARSNVTAAISRPCRSCSSTSTISNVSTTPSVMTVATRFCG